MSSIIEKYHQNDFLLNYIHNKLSDEEKSAFEAYLQQDEMLQDAVEGLSSIQQPSEIETIRIELNTFLQQQTTKKTKNNKNNHQQFLLWATIGILLLLTTTISIYIYFISLK